MRREDFIYDLPDERIARYPTPERSASRLLVVEPGGFSDRHMRDWPDLVTPRDLIVFNNSKVMPARLCGHKDSGGRVEILITEILSPTGARALLRSSKSPRIGTGFLLEGGVRLTVLRQDPDGWIVEHNQGEGWTWLERVGHIPIPPYLGRPDDRSDWERYQTVYAKHMGSVAAPTAGLHFDAPLLDELERRGIQSIEVTLHVGPGTFEPVRTEHLEDHRMHEEAYVVTPEAIERLTRVRESGGRIVAVGTTVVRTLETLAQNASPGQALRPGPGRTRLFIRPGFVFRLTDALLTNFHQPQSTLLPLVAAFAGTDRIRSAYAHALSHGYRFLSYGDAMWIPRRDGV
ncbi:MAG: tRNA preQ1(34) S-adenosylmethionine ribosyltransferase-isomerase QueA [Gammaproteobacteria bacterium]